MSGVAVVGTAVVGTGAVGTAAVGRLVRLDAATRDWATRALLRTLLWIQPDGGQGRARRNAWSSMVRESERRAPRLRVERSIALASAGADGSGPARRTVPA